MSHTTGNILALRAAACKRNAEIATQFRAGRKISQIWSLLGVSLHNLSVSVCPAATTSSDSSSSDINTTSFYNYCDSYNMWKDSVLGLQLLRKLLQYLVYDVNDLPTLATVTCVLGGSKQVLFLMCHDQEATHDSISGNWALRQFIDDSLVAYADLLARWGALVEATEVRKFIYLKPSHSDSSRVVKNDSIDDDKIDIKLAHDATTACLGINCMFCGSDTKVTSVSSNISASPQSADIKTKKKMKKKNKRKDAISGSTTSSGSSGSKVTLSNDVMICGQCTVYATYCSLCQGRINGSAYYCFSCGHGGHPNHLKEWFELHMECPTGCGCRCAAAAERYYQYEDPTRDADDNIYDDDNNTNIENTNRQIDYHNNDDDDDQDNDMMIDITYSYPY